MNAKLALAAAAALLVCPTIARAGGFDELPDQGAQAMGRGATFTAKADDATAIYYNVAGLARQRGTKLQLSANFHFNSMKFQRAGSYVDDPQDPLTNWGGEKYPLVEDKNASFTLPMLAVTSDFGYFDRLTFGLGVFGPSATGRTFPLGINGQPSPARYDHVQSQSTIIFPTLGAGYRITEHLDIGLSGILALAKLNEMSIAYADSGGGTCKNPEYQPCDVEGRLQAEGTGAGAALGVMYRPFEWLQLGGQVRSTMKVNANGSTTAKLGGGGPDKKAGDPVAATTAVEMPWIIRLGGRYIQMEKTATAKREVWDAELDLTFEAWGATASPTVTTADQGLGTGPSTITSVQNWKNTFSVRMGGAYNMPLDPESGSLVVFRAGAYYDAPTTDEQYTRIATNTLAKLAGTIGVGYQRGAFTVNAAYGAVLSFSRTVSNGEIRPENPTKSESVDGNGDPLPAVNNGDYSAFSHVVSLGVEVNFEAFFRDRKPKFGDAEYEDLDTGDKPKARPKKDDEKEGAGAEPQKTDAVTGVRKPAPEQVDPPGTWWKPGVPYSQLKDYDPGAAEDTESPPPRKKREVR
ncbi:MAG: outer membrane protein transport protein [Labilithrix sp.]